MADSREPTAPALIAHRGYSLRYPENTLRAIEAAFETGAAHVEFDVQMTADSVPVLLHDASLHRTTGLAADVMDLPASALRGLDAGEPQRLGDAFRGEAIPTLAGAAALLERWPQALAFVEIKQESLRRFGVGPFVDRLMEDLRPVLRRCVPISFDRQAVARARDLGAPAIGWVLEAAGDAARDEAAALRPRYLFCDLALLPGGALWPGPWHWAVYGVEDVETALRVAARGAHLIETKAVGELLGDPRLAAGRGGKTGIPPRGGPAEDRRECDGRTP